MPNAHDNEFLDHVLDLMASFGTVEAKRMFGGFGLFMEGLMFALIIDDVLYMKADEGTADRFIALELPPFVYRRQGKDVALSYYQAPDGALEEAEEMARWADMAYRAAVRADAGKRK